MIGFKALWASFKGKFGGGSNKVKVQRIKSLEEMKISAYTDVVNQDVINVDVKKKKTKGLSQFLNDVWIFITFHMKGLYWVQRMSGGLMARPVNPTEYNTMPTVMRNQKRIVNKQIIRMNDVSMKKVSGVYYMPKGRAAQVQKQLLAKQNKLKGAEVRKSFNELKTGQTINKEYARNRATFLELRAKMMADAGRDGR